MTKAALPRVGCPPTTWRMKTRLTPLWLLLLVPYIGLLWVPIYNEKTPDFLGFPFFYWYQLAWVPLTSILIWLVYRSLPHDE